MFGVEGSRRSAKCRVESNMKEHEAAKGAHAEEVALWSREIDELYAKIERAEVKRKFHEGKVEEYSARLSSLDVEEPDGEGKFTLPGRFQLKPKYRRKRSRHRPWNVYQGPLEYVGLRSCRDSEAVQLSDQAAHGACGVCGWKADPGIYY